MLHNKFVAVPINKASCNVALIGSEILRIARTTIDLLNMVTRVLLLFHYLKISLGNTLKHFISLQIRLMNLLSSSLCNYFYICVCLCIFLFICAFYECNLFISVYPAVHLFRSFWICCCKKVVSFKMFS